MSIDISSTNEVRLKATAKAEGVSVDAYVERLLDEREELAAIVTRSAERMPNLSGEDASAKIERRFLQSERGGARWVMERHSLPRCSQSLMNSSINTELDEPLCSNG